MAPHPDGSAGFTGTGGGGRPAGYTPVHPSARNRQPWDFVLVTGQDQLTELARVWQGAGHVARLAATIALVAPVVDEGRRGVLQFDLGQAAISMMIERPTSASAAGTPRPPTRIWPGGCPASRRTGSWPS